MLVTLPSSGAVGQVPERVRFATFNASLNRRETGELAQDLASRDNIQARKVAEIIQRVRPDVLVLNEFDFDEDGLAARLLQENYLNIGQGGQAPIRYPHRFTAPVNTGVKTEFDLDNDGRRLGAGDAQGFGFFPGQYGMVVYSRFPIDPKAVRTFQKFLWKDMPGALLPVDPQTTAPYYTAEELSVLRLSSKSHWDLPVQLGDRVIHLLCAHPTPPVFDGPEDRNGRRNHNEIRLWADYLDPERADYLVDDLGRRGGLQADAAFVIAGDMNADPLDGDSFEGAIRQLLEHPRVARIAAPRSEGASKAAARDSAGHRHRGDAANDTALFRGPGNLRADYVLPSKDLRIIDSGVFWPAEGEEGADLIDASDHRLVWIDIAP
jgi:3-phytase